MSSGSFTHVVGHMQLSHHHGVREPVSRDCAAEEPLPRRAHTAAYTRRGRLSPFSCPVSCFLAACWSLSTLWFPLVSVAFVFNTCISWPDSVTFFGVLCQICNVLQDIAKKEGLRLPDGPPCHKSTASAYTHLHTDKHSKDKRAHHYSPTTHHHTPRQQATHRDSQATHTQSSHRRSLWHPSAICGVRCSCLRRVKSTSMRSCIHRILMFGF